MNITDLSFDAKHSPLPIVDLKPKPAVPVQKPDSRPKDSPRSDREEFNKEAEDHDGQHERVLDSGLGLNSELSITFDKFSKQIVVRVLDKESKEVIREIPPETLAKIAESLKQLSVGLVNETA